MLNKISLDEHFEAQATSFSQVSKAEHKGVPSKRASSSRFTEYQLSELNKRFKSDPYIKGTDKELFAKNLGITMATVKSWFCRERKRLKQCLANEASNATVTALQECVLVCTIVIINLRSYFMASL